MIASRLSIAAVLGLALVGPASAGTSLVIDAASGALHRVRDEPTVFFGKRNTFSWSCSEMHTPIQNSESKADRR